MKRFSALALILVLLLSGCSPIENNLDKRLIIQGIGIDKKADNYKVTAMYMDTANPVGEADVTSSFVEGSGSSVLDALTDTANKTGREPLYGQCAFIVLGGGLINDGIKEPLEFFTDYYEFHPNINIFCSEMSAEKIMRAENMSVRLMQDFADTEASTGKTISSTLNEVYSALCSGRTSAVTALLDIEDKNVVLKGAVAFNGDKKGATLNNAQCMAVLLMCGDAKSVWDIFPSDEGSNINYSLSDCKSNIALSTDGELEFDIAISAHASAYASQSDSRLEAKINSRIKSLCENAIEQLLKKKRLDVFNLERTLYRQNYGLYKSLENPKQSVVLSRVNVQVDIELKK
ncbi:MAG: Ger(x)C family spore germination C-terminal domain-containing protein [Acutalibacteraceae bacterium]